MVMAWILWYWAGFYRKLCTKVNMISWCTRAYSSSISGMAILQWTITIYFANIWLWYFVGCSADLTLHTLHVMAVVQSRRIGACETRHITDHMPQEIGATAHEIKQTKELPLQYNLIMHCGYVCMCNMLYEQHCLLYMQQIMMHYHYLNSR